MCSCQLRMMPMTETCRESRGSSAAGATEPIGDASSQRSQKFAVVGGILGAIAASSCCILPLVLFSLGISGAWIGNLTALAPYQPYFIAATLACLGYGYWLVYRRKTVTCADEAACGRAESVLNRRVKVTPCRLRSHVVSRNG